MVVCAGGSLQDLASIAIKYTDEEISLVFLWEVSVTSPEIFTLGGGTQVVHDRTPKAAMLAVEFARNLFKQQHNDIKLMFGYNYTSEFGKVCHSLFFTRQIIHQLSLCRSNCLLTEIIGT